MNARTPATVPPTSSPNTSATRKKPRIVTPGHPAIALPPSSEAIPVRPRPAFGIVAARYSRAPFPYRVIPLVLFVAICLFASGCTSKHGGASTHPGPTVVRAATSGAPRTVSLGFSSLPPDRTSDAYISAFATAAQYADVVEIQRTPPWEDFLPGGSISKATADTTRTETELLDQYKNLKRFYAIDPTDSSVQRSRIANLPAGIDPQKGFLDPKIQQAFLAYTAYVVSNYKPDYLAIGVEINMLYERSPEQFNAFVALYHKAYDVAKAASPNIKVFPTFQLEDLEGTFATIHPPHWEVIDPFRDKMDALAISTYPFLSQIRSTSDIAPDYYAQLKQHYSGEILISETGYASAPVDGQVLVGTEEDQQAFLTRILTDAEKDGFSLVVWSAALDPSFATVGSDSVFKDIGLRHSDGSNKLAWTTWEQWSRRPLKPK